MRLIGHKIWYSSSVHTVLNQALRIPEINCSEACKCKSVSALSEVCFSSPSMLATAMFAEVKLKRSDVSVPVICPYVTHLHFGVVLHSALHGCA